jgi:hypothetical protein
MVNFFVAIPVGNDIGKQFVKSQIGFKYKFGRQPDGLAKPFQLLAQGIQLGQLIF